MKKLLSTFLILTSFLLVSFIPGHFDGDIEGDPIKYEVIAGGTLSNSDGIPVTDCFSLDNQFDYDDFWMAQHRSLSDKPTVNMNDCKILVLLKAGNIDNITLSSESINIYMTSILPGSTYTTYDIKPRNYCLVKIDYNGKPVRVFQHFVTPDYQTGQ